MGFKIRAGMAVGGMALSYFFGLSFLSGIASHLDTTGNILVDIADGIGLVSKVCSWLPCQPTRYLETSKSMGNLGGSCARGSGTKLKQYN